MPTGYYNRDTNKAKQKKLYGDGTTDAAWEKKRKQTIREMNERRRDVGEEVIDDYKITRRDVRDITKINVNVLRRLNYNEATTPRAEWERLEEKVRRELKIDEVRMRMEIE